MSVRLMSLVFASKVKPTQKLVLLALADYASDDGCNVYPSVETLTGKTSLKERAIRGALVEMREAGLLVVVRPARQHYPAEYRIDIDKLMEYSGVQEMPVRDAGDAPLEPSGVQEMQSRGAGNAPKPSENHQLKHNPSGESSSSGKPSGSDPPAKELDASLTEGQKLFLQTFGATRFKNKIQRDAVLEMERKYGTDCLGEGLRWAAKNGMSLSKAVVSLESALPKWGKPKTSTNGSKPPRQNNLQDALSKRRANGNQG
jgi:hypothetical protein